jgi:ParB family chromosome partitioning protein
MKRRALGKGLSALIPEPEPKATGETTTEVPIGSLEPNPSQPRNQISAPRLEELCASIREAGMIQPILVRRHRGRYQIIAGERRWRAAQKLDLPRVPVTVRDVPDERLLELALVENLQREDLGPLEEAQAYQRLQRELGLTQEEVAKRVGRDRSTVANTLRLLRLPRAIRELISERRLEAGHGRALLALDNAEEQLSLAREAARRGLSVREVERRVAALRAPATKSRGSKDPNTRAAEERLRSALGTRVEIARRGRGGYVKLAFANEAELDRLYERLIGVRR